MARFTAFQNTVMILQGLNIKMTSDTAENVLESMPVWHQTGYWEQGDMTIHRGFYFGTSGTHLE